MRLGRRRRMRLRRSIEGRSPGSGFWVLGSGKASLAGQAPTPVVNLVADTGPVFGYGCGSRPRRRCLGDHRLPETGSPDSTLIKTPEERRERVADGGRRRAGTGMYVLCA